MTTSEKIARRKEAGEPSPPSIGCDESEPYTYPIGVSDHDLPLPRKQLASALRCIWTRAGVRVFAAP